MTEAIPDPTLATLAADGGLGDLRRGLRSIQVQMVADMRAEIAAVSDRAELLVLVRDRLVAAIETAPTPVDAKSMGDRLVKVVIDLNRLRDGESR